MTWLGRCLRRLRGAFSRFDDRTVREELDLHLDLLADEFREQGLSEVEARSRAERAFGNRTRTVELTRAVTTLPRLESLLNDVVYGARQLRRSPAVTTLAVLSLAIGIGANTAVFSIIDALVLRSLPVPAPDRLAALSLGDHEATRVAGSRWSYAFWKAFALHQDRFDGVMAWSPARVSVSRDDAVQSVDAVFVNGGFFGTLRLRVNLGRPLEPGDDRSGAPPVVVISHGYWQRQFGGSADVIGRTILIDEAPFAVVGVTPPAFSGLEVGQAADLILPLSALDRGAESNLRPPLDGMNMWLRIGVRLRSDQTLDSASAIVRGLQPQLREASIPAGFPQLRQTLLREPIGLVSAANGLSRVRHLYQRPLNALIVVVGVVLLLACVNVANLLLAQATAREHELGVRLALGASRRRVARQLLMESALLTGAGVAIGLLVARWAAQALVSQLSAPNAPVTLALSLDWRVLAVTSMLGVITTLVCGTAAALRVNAIAPGRALNDVAYGTTGSRRAGVPDALLASQMALSLTLVVAASLFVGTFVRLTSVPLGFDRDAVLLATAGAAQANVPPEQRLALYERLVEVVREVPGVAQAAASTMMLVSAWNAPIFVTPVRSAEAPATSAGEAKSMFVTPGWFATYGLDLVAGRDLTRSDTAASAQVMVVNRAFVDRYFEGRAAVGEMVDVALGIVKAEYVLPRRAIVGVVENAVYQSLREAPPPTVYFPLAQYDYPVAMGGSIFISVRGRTAPVGALAQDVTTAITGVDPRVTVTTRTLSSQVMESIRRERILAELSGLFGAMAVFLAAAGLFGITSYSVARRRREIAVRVAVGASRGDVLRAVMGRVFVPIVLGLAGGIALSLWLSRLVAALFFGVSPGDPYLLVLASAALVGTAMLAAWIPARRAHQVNPAGILRAS